MIPKITDKIMDQRPTEYRSWTAMCIGMGVQKYVELGMGGGGTANYMKEAGVGQIVVVDLISRLDWNIVLRNDIGFIQEDSQDPKTLSKVLELLGGEPDVVFIDADHSSEGVRKDFELWWPVAKMMVGFHDIFIPTVNNVWNGLCVGISSIQIVGRDYESASIWQDRAPMDGTLPCGGIGVLFKG